MFKQNGVLSVVALVVMLALANTSRAADPVPTTISIPSMDCGGCAKKIVAQLIEVPGVALAEPNMEKKSIRVTPKLGAVLSPKALWEAVEKTNKQPVKLEGPSGWFAAKPQS